jgi:hypothetical protein
MMDKIPELANTKKSLITMFKNLHCWRLLDNIDFRTIMIGTLTALQWFIYDVVKVSSICKYTQLKYKSPQVKRLSKNDF